MATITSKTWKMTLFLSVLLFATTACEPLELTPFDGGFADTGDDMPAAQDMPKQTEDTTDPPVDMPDPPEMDMAQPPAGDPVAGEAIFRDWTLACSGCHGADAKQDALGNPDGNLSVTATEDTDEQIRTIMREGKPPMPKYSTDQISDDAITDLIAFIRTLAS